MLLDEALKTPIKPEELKNIIESDNTEKKFRLGLQIIFSTQQELIGWNILNTLNLSTIVDEKFIADIFINTNIRNLPSRQLIKFINFVLQIHSSKMAIPKPPEALNTPKKPKDSESLDIESILAIIALIEQHNISPDKQINVCELLIKEISKIPSPRDADNIKLFNKHILTISECFKKITIRTEDRLRFLEFLYNQLTHPETHPLMSLGFLLIPDTMITQAVEYFFKTLQWNGRKTEESVVASLGVLIYWSRTTNMPVPLELWITKILSVLSINGLYDIVNEVAKKNMIHTVLTLCVPLFQMKIFPVVQVLFEHSRNRKELIDMILPRIFNLLKQLETTNSKIFYPFIDLICETLASIDYTEEKYKDLVQYLQLRNRPPSKVVAKKIIGPNLRFLSNNARVGLENLGNTCYLNSVLQALFMTKQFCREILTTERSDRTIIALQKLFALMLFSPRPEQNPSLVVNLIRPDDFLPGIQHDSSEFLGSILDKLHELERKIMKNDEDWDNENECNNASSRGPENKESMELVVPMDIDDSDKRNDEPKDKVVDNTSNLYQTYVQKIFGGKICTRYLCSTCNNNSINVDSFRDLQLSFPEKTENEECDVQYNVQQLLEFYFSTEELTSMGDNQYHCDNCKILCNGMRCTEILEPPRNLILTLKHFRYDSRHHIRSKLLYKVLHDEVITMNVKGSFNTNSTRNVDYKLYAAIVHSGTSLDSGHYYTIARENDNQWFKFNDSFVTKSSLEELRSLISPNTPYILFYQRLSTASSTIVHHSESASTSASSLLTNQINDQNFPDLLELPTFLRDIIDEDKLKFETEMYQQNNKMTYRAPVRDNFDDNDPSNGSFGSLDDSFAHSRFIY